MPIGKLKTWNDERGFGFLRAEDGSSGEDTFVHISAFRAADIYDPQLGDVFEFAAQRSRDDRTQAGELVRLHRVGEQ
ncbi:cold-shock protein [Devosia naphthalenivorans]|uniref:cold-shock protein n=1 Tax=Devosia naphthalenivorans TaxID=2082392 RepID=UPI000D3BACFF|nr:cold shock domain-containing protein [Devosia naphthalenivorans]